MIIHYLDSSAWVKNYCRETGSQWIRELIAGGLPLASSSLGLIEVMKVFTAVKTEVAGTVEKILIDNAETIEFGQPLFLIRPDA